MLFETDRQWVFHNPVAIAFGAGCRALLPLQLESRRLLVVATRRGRVQFMNDPHLAMLGERAVWVDSITQNPGLADTQAEIDRLKGQDFDAVLAFGGGSAMDAAKALAAALAPGAGIRDLDALISAPAEHLTVPPLPIHAVTTTSGTGAEVTPFATIWNHEEHRKLSLAHPGLFPVSATIDPELTYDLPAQATLSTGLDALNQALESVWNRNRSPVTLMFAGRAIALALSALPRLVSSLADTDARSRIAEASLLAGLCISQTRTAICHAMSYPLTAHFGMPHGFACAFTMGEVARQVLDEAPQVLDVVAPHAGFADAAELTRALMELLERLRLRDMAASWLPAEGDSALLDLRDEMYTPGRSDNFILPITDERIENILSATLHPYHNILNDKIVTPNA